MCEDCKPLTSEEKEILSRIKTETERFENASGKGIPYIDFIPKFEQKQEINKV